MTRIDLSKQSGIAVLDLLTKAGHKAFVVGGPVRNALMGLPISDLDVATDARPEVVLALAKQAGLKGVPTGIDHGTVTIVVDGEGVEVTTFRQDVATDGRRAVVAYATTIAEDARRRDFTMNALYADASGMVQDPLGGLPDLQARRVRFIDDPAQRIREDYLRILRFFRFYAWYGAPEQGIDAEGLAACAALADGIETLSKERIGAEMLKLLSAPNPAPALAAMEQSGVLRHVLTGATAQTVAVLVHLEEMHGFAPEHLRRLVALGGEGKGAALRLSEKQTMHLHNMENAIESGMPATEAGYRLGRESARSFVLLQAAMTGVSPTDVAFDDADRGAAAKFPLRAADLPTLEGPALGQALSAAERAWIASGFTLSKAALIAKSAG